MVSRRVEQFVTLGVRTTEPSNPTTYNGVHFPDVARGSFAPADARSLYVSAISRKG
jgi:hypothetical protein